MEKGWGVDCSVVIAVVYGVLLTLVLYKEREGHFKFSTNVHGEIFFIIYWVELAYVHDDNL